ncbi:MAG: STAS domain-containing protein [Archangium sp.]|nr:STAS domain-containing protein [Archangium sp.]
MVKLDLDGPVLRLSGRLDVHSVKQAHQTLQALGASPGRIDAKSLEGLDTAGAQWLFVLARRRGGSLEVVNAPKPVVATLKAAGFEGWVVS